jgi:hypothetical protein
MGGPPAESGPSLCLRQLSGTLAVAAVMIAWLSVQAQGRFGLWVIIWPSRHGHNRKQRACPSSQPETATCLTAAAQWASYQTQRYLDPRHADLDRHRYVAVVVPHSFKPADLQRDSRPYCIVERSTWSSCYLLAT